jgi:hypothetical protein
VDGSEDRNPLKGFAAERSARHATAGFAGPPRPCVSLMP